MPAWSYTALTAFETCPRKYYHTRVAKDIVEPETQALTWGNAVHKALELRVANNTPLPTGMTQWEPLVSKLTSRGEVVTEKAIALDKELAQVDWFDRAVWVRGKLDLTIIQDDTLVVLDYKGFPLDTELPTPAGFASIGSLSVGDEVLSGDGRACKVVGKSPIKSRQCYRIAFDDKTEVVCDDQHLWALSDGRVVPVTELVAGDLIALCGVAQHTHKELPLDPYVLGVWLADGKHTSGEVSKADAFVFEEIARRGYEVGPDISAESRCEARTVKGIRSLLTKLGVLRNKHIPDMYLTASPQQRLDLLRGLMDGDGSVNTTRKQAVFCTTNPLLSTQAKQLIESLGQRVNRMVAKATGFGLTVTKYDLSFRPQKINPFLTPRKADKVRPEWGPGMSWRRAVQRVSKSVVMDTVCIAVDSSDNTFLCGRNYLRTHNTGQPKSDGSQLQLFAAMALAIYPKVDRVKTGFVWLKTNGLDVNQYTREEAPDIWSRFAPRVAKLEEAYETNTWPEIRSGLCRAWCPCSSCPNNGRYGLPR